MEHRREYGSEPEALPLVAEIFLTTKESEGLRENTIILYRRVLENLYRLPGVPEDPAELTKHHINLFLVARRKAGNATATIAQRQRMLYVYLRWLYDDGSIERDITRQVKLVRVETEPKATVRPQDMTRMLSVLTMPPPEKRGARIENRERNNAILHLMFDSGLRASEIQALNIADVDMKNRVAFVHASTSKTGKFHRAPFTVGTKIALLEWLRVRPELAKKSRHEEYREGGPFFLSRRGERLSYTALHQFVTKLSRRAGERFTPHDFRRGSAAHQLSRGVAATSVQRNLGHASLTMTQQYAEAGADEAALKEYREKIG